MPSPRRSVSSCFNPRPPLLAGECSSGLLLERGDDVSIHARHCWRANVVPATRSPHCAVFQSTPAIAGGRMDRVCRPPRPCQSFNPRPPLLAGEWPTTPADRATMVFQSTPAIAGGRMRLCRACRGPCGSFNPRPPLLAGEWRQGVAGRGRREVSIHARHCWRANEALARLVSCSQKFQSTPAIAGGRMRILRPALPAGRQFQSTPAIAGGRMPEKSDAGACVTGFNPRPPLLAGECGERRLELRGGDVSIHARHCWRANESQRCRARPRWTGFNPRPPLLAGECSRRAPS